MDYCNGLPTPIRVEEYIGKDENGPEAKRDLTESYSSVIGMMLYFKSNTRPHISFAVNQFVWLNHNTG